MLNKNEIIKGLTDEEFLVKNAIYEYVCRLHLYDDEQINKALIEFIESNYQSINFVGLIYSKLNKEIIECLIKILLKEKDEFYKEKISRVLVEHYNLIKDMDYDFEKLITDEDNLLVYKKIKHFSKKDPSQLIELYRNNVNQYYFSEEETYTTEILRKAIGEALIQTEEGFDKLLEYIDTLVDFSNDDEDEIIEKITFEHMPYLVYPLCKYADEGYYLMILDLYINNMDFIAYAEDCNYYFSNVCNDEIVNSYIDFLKGFRKKHLEDYFYDIAEYLNSSVIDEFLFEELERIKDIKIRENIIRILANRFNKHVIPYALDFIKKGEFDDEEGLKEAITPLLILENCSDELSKNIIEEVKKFYIFDLLGIDDNRRNEIMSNVLNKMQNLLLKDKPHIKKYKKIRKLHNEIMESMMKYVYEGKFEFKVDNSRNKINIKNIKYLDTEFDTSTELGIQAMSNVLVYKNSCNTNCVTEEYIEKKKFRTEEKNELLESMLNSIAGLFEITETDREKGQVHLKDVLTNKEYCITDIGFSSNLHNDKIYLYTRIITYQDISFGTGFNLVFDKNDKFICKWIKENLNKPEKQEIERVIELYNEYKKDNKGIKVVTKNM